jgi:hypothetical protein
VWTDSGGGYWRIPATGHSATGFTLSLLGAYGRTNTSSMGALDLLGGQVSSFGGKLETDMRAPTC